MAEKKSPRKLLWIRFRKDGVNYAIPFCNPLERDEWINRRYPQVAKIVGRWRAENARKTVFLGRRG